jgi:signal transduction histidine kinase
MSRLRPQSIRVRDTMIAAVISLLVFGLLGAAAAMLIHTAQLDRHYRTVESAARRVTIDLREGRLTRPIRPDPSGIDQLQVVDTDGHVVNATPAARHQRLSSALPSAQERFLDRLECRPGHRCQLVHAIRAMLPDHVTYYVYAAKDVPGILLPGVLPLLIGVVVSVLTAFTAGVVWKIVGRTLAPIEAIRAQLMEISATDLSRRVPETDGEDEIARLARTANQTLDRLECLVKRQRQFTADASHELRTPVAGLRANLEDALTYPDDADRGDTLGAALRDTERIEAIITDLLLLARLGTGGPAVQQRVDLAELVTLEADGRQADIRTNLCPGAIVTGVPAQLTRLLANLLDNAQRHAEGVIEVEVDREGDQARLIVADDGPGILIDNREVVFQRFSRLDTARGRAAGGTGLGLAIARDIARAHGGTLRVEDSPRGARFVLRLPVDECRPSPRMPGVRPSVHSAATGS